MASVRFALVQMKVAGDVATNLASARSKALAAKAHGAQVIVLPECFNSPYGTKYFRTFAEPIDGNTGKALSAMAKECKTFLVGGSFPELALDGELYNTCTVYGPDGELLAVHRKVHLFDIDIPGKITFKESDSLAAGNSLTSFKTPWGRISVCICYDIRFPEVAMVGARSGSVALVVPGAFNMTTGPLHWELLLRARAVDNQIFTFGCGPAHDEEAEYHAWGHSTAVDPFGKVIATTEGGEDIVYADMDLKVMEDARAGIPITTHRRFDVYPDVNAGPSLSPNKPN